MKKIAVGILASSLSLSVLAMTGEGYKVLWTKETISPGATGWIEHDVDKKTSSNWVTAGSVAYDAKGKKNTNIALKGVHCYQIVNQTGGKKRYSFHYDLNSASMSHVFDGELELVAGGRVEECANNYLVVNIPKPSQYLISVITQIKGPASAIDSKNAKLIVNN